MNFNQWWEANESGYSSYENFAREVWEASRAEVIQLLDGIDKTECDAANGWWETSEGASFGASILKQIKGDLNANSN